LYFWSLSQKKQRSKEKTKKTMVKRKDQKYNGQKKRPKIQWSKEINTSDYPFGIFTLFNIYFLEYSKVFSINDFVVM
jgi:hypothetical protein